MASGPVPNAGGQELDLAADPLRGQLLGMHEHAHGFDPGLLVGDQGLADIGLELARNLTEYCAYARVFTVVIAQGGSDAVEALVDPGRGHLP